MGSACLARVRGIVLQNRSVGLLSSSLARCFSFLLKFDLKAKVGVRCERNKFFLLS